MAVHSLTAQLLPSGEALPITSFEFGADQGSFGWSFTINGPLALFDALAPTGGLPRSVKVNFDGIEFVMVVGDPVKTQGYGVADVTVPGASVTALLGSQYSRSASRLNAAQITAQQAAIAALEFTGVDLDWGLTDWLLPAGAWSHTGTSLAAVQEIVEAAGGYVQSHRSLPTLLARHPYPLLPGGALGGPWNWGGAFAADVELPPEFLDQTSITRKFSPAINGVWVSGTLAGSPRAHIKRAGTAGNLLPNPDQVAHQLITHIDAAQQCGLAIVGAAGPKYTISGSMPIVAGGSNPGILEVGQLVQINETTPWRGRIRSVGGSAEFGGSPRQQFTIERHLEAV